MCTPKHVPSVSPVVGANQNHLGALLGKHSQSNLSHQVTEMGGIDESLGGWQNTETQRFGLVLLKIALLYAHKSRVAIVSVQ